jgi:MFS family permease
VREQHIAIAVVQPTRTSAPGKTAWTIVLLLTTMLIGTALMAGIFGPLQEAARLSLKLSDFQISLIQGIGTGIPVAIFSIPIAWVIDHGHRQRLLLSLMGVCAVGTLWTGFADGFASLFMARMLCSLGALSGLAVVVSMAADLSPADRRGRVMLVLTLGVWVGAAAAFAVGGTLFSYFEHNPRDLFGTSSAWRQTHFVIGLAGALLIAPLLFVREPLRHEVEQTSSALRPALKALWAKRRFLTPLFIGQLGVVMADTAAGIWAAPVLIRNYHLQPGEFGAWLGGLILVSGVLGSVVGGYTADRGHRTGRRGGLFYGAIVAAVIGTPTALFCVMPTLPGFALLLGLLLFCGTIISLTSAIAVAVLVPNEERGLCMAVFGIIRSIIGLSVAPTLVTLGSSAMGGEHYLAPALAMVGIATGILSFVGYGFAAKNAPSSPTAIAAA